MLIYIFLTISLVYYTVLFFFIVTLLEVWRCQNIWLSRSLGNMLSHKII